MRIDFYHLQKEKLEDVLPKLLEKAFDTKKTILVKVGNEEKLEPLNTLLWTYKEESFIPHGSKKDGKASKQPIWFTSDDDNPNNAKMFFLVEGAKAVLEEGNEVERILNIFDGNNEQSLSMARKYWKELSSEGYECHYWKQDMAGKWLQQV